jgi:DNA repair exonuclease SbcCD ATPase subunit
LVEHWAQQYKRGFVDRVACALEFGRTVHVGKTSLGYGGWEDLFHRRVELELPFAKTVGKCWGQIGEVCGEVGRDPDHLETLPAGFGALYQLSRLGIELLFQAIRDKAVRSDLTEAEAKEVLSLAANPPTLAIRVATATSDLSAKQNAAAVTARELAVATKTAADKQKALAAATETQTALAVAVAALAKVKEPTAEAKSAVESLTAAKSAADAAVEKLTKENTAIQSRLAASEQANKTATAALETAKRTLDTAAADQKAFDELPAKLSAAVAETSQRLERLTTELTQVQALAEAAEAEQKQFAQAYGVGKTQSSSESAAQVTASSDTPRGR